MSNTDEACYAFTSGVGGVTSADTTDPYAAAANGLTVDERHTSNKGDVQATGHDVDEGDWDNRRKLPAAVAATQSRSSQPSTTGTTTPPPQQVSKQASPSAGGGTPSETTCNADAIEMTTPAPSTPNATASTPPSKRRKKTEGIFQNQPHEVFLGSSQLPTWSSVLDLMRKLAMDEFGSDPIGLNGLNWIKKDWKSHQSKNRRCVYYCAFHHECNCQARLEVVEVHKPGTEPSEVDHYYVRKSSVPHSDHTIEGARISGVPLVYRRFLQSVKDTPSVVLKRIMSTHTVDEALQEKIKHWVKKAKLRFNKRGTVPRGVAPGSWTLLKTMVEAVSTRPKRESGVSQEHNEHTAYLLASQLEPVAINNNQSQEMSMVSTENLLLNARSCFQSEHHQSQQDDHAAAPSSSSSYSLKVGKSFCLLPIFAASPAQKGGQLVAMAILNKKEEDGGDHHLLFHGIKHEVERLLQEQGGEPDGDIKRFAL